MPNQENPPVYAVTYCTQDQSVGANPLWHTFIFLSRSDPESGMLEVVDNFGFYGLPSTSAHSYIQSYIRQLKIMLGLDVDFQGNHGMLRREEARTIDRGHGLHGVTFELTQQQFEQLHQRCLGMINDQNNAVNDVVSGLELKGKERYRIYAHEKYSRHILALEQAAAREQNRESRLKLFEFRPLVPRTCKMQAIELVKGVLTPEQVNRITGLHRAVSRWSGPMEDLYLFSTGPTREHKKSSGEVVKFRDLNDEGVRVFWGLPPQERETLSDATDKMLDVNSELVGTSKSFVNKLIQLSWIFENSWLFENTSIKSIVSKLIQLRWLFENASIKDEVMQQYRAGMVEEIDRHLHGFAKLSSTKSQPIENSWSNYGLWLFSQPRNQQEKELMGMIDSAKLLFITLHSAVVDNWEIGPSDNIEALACHISTKDQQKLCSILGKSYFKDDIEDEQVVSGHFMAAPALAQ